MMKKSGFTLIEVMVVVAILGLLAAVGIPSMMNAYQNSLNKAAEINITNVEAAIDQWAVINNKRPGDAVAFADIKDFLGANVKTIDDLKVGTNEISIYCVGTDTNVAYETMSL